MKKLLVILMMSYFVVGCVPGNSETEESRLEKAEQQLRKVLGPGAMVEELVGMGDNQMYAVMMSDGGTLHMTPDLNYFIYQDTFYQITEDGFINISDSRLDTRRKKEMAAIADEDTVIFKAKGEEKAVVNVFTDIDCGYCQLLHQEIPELNELGITVRYLAYPRSGVVDRSTGELTTSYRKINYVWCQADRQTAMTEMKSLQRKISQAYSATRSGSEASRNQAFAEYEALQVEMGKLLAGKHCDSPVERHYQLGSSIGVSGTPAMVTQDGALMPGYVPAKELAKRLNI